MGNVALLIPAVIVTVIAAVVIFGIGFAAGWWFF